MDCEPGPSKRLCVSDTNFSDNILDLLNETFSDIECDDEDGIESDHFSDFEQSDDGEEDQNISDSSDSISDTVNSKKKVFIWKK